MDRPPPPSDTGDEIVARPDRGPATGPPRWMAVLGIILAVGLLALMVALHLSGSLGPGAH